ncbi:sensory neuron membrane protein 2-like [Agrilus planipennis]|uniref:Sensory neuron membrane protein 2 n=1 Tax=Agrilus planipennis TaxID=224129 RepID=A0A1W4WXF6_AGRPL|nr:sensory neuron membrane protein 2-like [Agrilus planipennis]
MFEEPYAFFSATIRELMFEGTTICHPNKTDSIGKLLCLVLMLIRQKNMIYNDDLSITFSFFGYRNNTNDGVYSVNTGESDISKVGTISTWENSAYTTYWSGSKSSCNRVEGSRTTVFPPFLEESMKFDVFSTDICKSANIIYNKTNTYHDIEGYRFRTYLNSFTSSDDDCYCTDGAKDLDGNDTCFSDGLLNLYTCHAAPILLSYPHFLWLEESLSKTVEGLNASEDKHTTYVDIDPYLGIPLQSSQKVQFNLILRPYVFGNGTLVSLTQNLSRALTPFLWIDEGMALTSDITDEMRSELYDRLKLLNIVEWVIIALGIVFIIVPPAAYGIKKLRTSDTKGAIKKN